MNTVTVALATAVPCSTRLATLLELVSLGAAGGTVAMVKAAAVALDCTTPAPFTALAVMVWEPSDRMVVAAVQVPLAATCTSVSRVAPSKSWSREPAWAMPENRGWAWPTEPLGAAVMLVAAQLLLAVTPLPVMVKLT